MLLNNLSSILLSSRQITMQLNLLANDYFLEECIKIILITTFKENIPYLTKAVL